MLGAGRRELKELEKTAIDKRIFIKISVCMREGKVMASGFEGGSSADVALMSMSMNDVVASVVVVKDLQS